ncbi:MAG: serine/threonine-protein kinase [Pseudomonadota bacterium]
MTDPTQLGRYRIVQAIGSGSMGMVYEGRDPVLNRRVAIKVIAANRIADAERRADYLARFTREAQAVARLNHPNIVTVYDFGEQAGVAYLVMELIPGEELGGYFGEGQAFQLEFTTHDAVRMTCELLDALGYAHQNGVVHRDVKPANIMLGADLSIKLTDFGVARLTERDAGEADQCAPGSEMAGTPSFMSPEQIGGQKAGPRADIFGAGIILYQFLTNERPFRGKGRFAVQQKIMYEHPLPPSLLNPALSPAFDTIVARALAKRPEDRYPDALSFKRDLQRALAGAPVQPHEAAAELALGPMATAPLAGEPDPDATLPAGFGANRYPD